MVSEELIVIEKVYLDLIRKNNPDIKIYYGSCVKSSDFSKIINSTISDENLDQKLLEFKNKNIKSSDVKNKNIVYSLLDKSNLKYSREIIENFGLNRNLKGAFTLAYILNDMKRKYGETFEKTRIISNSDNIKTIYHKIDLIQTELKMYTHDSFQRTVTSVCYEVDLRIKELLDQKKNKEALEVVESQIRTMIRSYRKQISTYKNICSAIKSYIYVDIPNSGYSISQKNELREKNNSYLFSMENNIQQLEESKQMFDESLEMIKDKNSSTINRVLNYFDKRDNYVGFKDFKIGSAKIKK